MHSEVIKHSTTDVWGSGLAEVTPYALKDCYGKRVNEGNMKSNFSAFRIIDPTHSVLCGNHSVLCGQYQ